MTISQQAIDIASKVEDFVRNVVIPYEQDPRRDHHGAPTDELVYEMRKSARSWCVDAAYFARWRTFEPARNGSSAHQERIVAAGAAGVQYDGAR